jgi:hypothetical protein
MYVKYLVVPNNHYPDGLKDIKSIIQSKRHNRKPILKKN